VGLLERIAERRRGGTGETRSSIDGWISDFLIPGSFGFGGTTYQWGGIPGLTQTLAGNRAMEVAQSIPGYAAALQRCPPAFAAELVRSLVLSQAKFTFRNKITSATPRRTFGTRELGVLETPWPRGTTGDLVARMEWHAGLTGNSYVVRQGARLRVLRPDWVGVLYGSQLEPDSQYPGHALDGELVGFVYWNGGVGNGSARVLLPDEVAWWSPVPDPLSPGMGMSWLTPAIRDMQADRIVTDHKIAYFENGATPNLVVKGLPAQTPEQFAALVDLLEDRHTGQANAYRTIYLSSGADATVIGSNLGEIDLKTVQGASETRISFLSRVPAPILGISEGLAGSSLNAGNFGQSRRLFADSWVFPTLQSLAAALAPIINVPADAELWTSTADIPLLREDAQDAATIAQTQASTIAQLITAGFVPETVVQAVNTGDMTLLRHSGLVSVQLLPPGQGTEPGTAPPPGTPPAPPAPALPPAPVKAAMPAPPRPGPKPPRPGGTQ
jgi:hypothetical protein